MTAIITSFTAEDTSLYRGYPGELHAEYSGGVGYVYPGGLLLEPGGSVKVYPLEDGETYTLIVDDGQGGVASATVTFSVTFPTKRCLNIIDPPEGQTLAQVFLDLPILVILGSLIMVHQYTQLVL